MQRLGFYNTPSDRQFVQEYFQQILQIPNNIVEQFTKTFINETGMIKEVEIEVRESLLGGKSGKFAKVKSSWQVLPDGTRRFISAELYGV